MTGEARTILEAPGAATYTRSYVCANTQRRATSPVISGGLTMGPPYISPLLWDTRTFGYYGGAIHFPATTGVPIHSATMGAPYISPLLWDPRTFSEALAHAAPKSSRYFKSSFPVPRPLISCIHPCRSERSFLPHMHTPYRPQPQESRKPSISSFMRLRECAWERLPGSCKLCA